MSVVASCEWSVPVSSVVHSSDKSEVPMCSRTLNLTFDPPVPRPWAGMEGSSKERVCQAQYPPLLGVVSGVILGRFQGVSLHLLHTHTSKHLFQYFPNTVSSQAEKSRHAGNATAPQPQYLKWNLNPTCSKCLYTKMSVPPIQTFQGNPGDSFSTCDWLVPQPPPYCEMIALQKGSPCLWGNPYSLSMQCSRCACV